MFDGKPDGMVDLPVKLAPCNGVHRSSAPAKIDHSLTIEWM
jgi:hypothetical protein